jgi:hypothetical protein
VILARSMRREDSGVGMGHRGEHMREVALISEAASVCHLRPTAP